MTEPKRRAVIITALPVERDAVLEHLRDIAEEAPVRGSVYRRGIFDEKSEPWEVLVAEIGPGNERAAAEAERILGHFNPEVAIFVGVAGAFKDLSRGDIVAATKIYNYEAGKDAQTDFQTRPELELSAHALLSRARYEAGERRWLERIRPARPGLTPPPGIRATVGPIAAGPKVLASTRSATHAFIQEKYGDTLAVEMEGFGFLRSVHMNHPIQGIVVRGISDCIGDKTPGSDIDWQPVAARHAAAFAFQILAKLEPDTRSARPRAVVGAAADVQRIEAYWQALKGIAQYPLIEAVFTASREPEVAAVDKWIAGPPASLWMRVNGLTNALDFIAALSSRDDFTSLRRAVIVHSPTAWRQLVALREPQVLIAAPALEIQATDVSGAVQAGHHVLVSGPRANLADGSAENLRRQDYYAVSKALIECGFPEARAMSLARGCCGSSSILKRLITAHPDTEFPLWSHDGVREVLAPFALIGGWKHVDPPAPGSLAPKFGSSPPLDVWAVSELVGCTRDQLDQYVARWYAGAEPLFVRFGSSVLVASREDAWYLLAGAISASQIKRFRDLAELILEEDNPAFELAPDQRWMASVYGKTHLMSDELRRSIVETLALMGTYPTPADLTATVRSVLERVLPAGAPWQRWASIGRNLPIVAEADPDLFLSRVEADLRSPDPELLKLFQDKGDGIFGGGAIHSDLLWALEGLAWAPKYLARVSVCLAKLASRDPGGTYANRPANSLHHIFLWWYWQTNATLEERIEALSAVMAAEPRVGWNLLKSLLPSGASDISTNNHIPRWRPWADGWSREKLRSMAGKYAIEIARLTMSSAGADPQRWTEIIDGMLRFNPEITEEVFGVLERICDSAAPLNPEFTFALWKEVRNLVAKHDRYSDAAWAFEKPVCERLRGIRDRLEPSDVVFKHCWLFDQRAELPGINRVQDYAAHDQALRRARLDAVKRIEEQSGAAGIQRLLELGADAWMVGWLVGHQGLLAPADMNIPVSFDSPNTRRSEAARGYVSGRFSADNWAFVRDLPLREWTPSQVANLGMCLQFEAKTWEWLSKQGEEAVREYWRHIRGFLRNPTLEDLRIATASYISVGRGGAAIEILQVATASDNFVAPNQFIAETLENALIALGSPESSGGDLGYHVQQLVQLLQRDREFDHIRLARIEWGYLPLLDPEFTEVGPETLIDVINSEPSFYVDLLKIVFRSENETGNEVKLTEQDRNMAQHASRLLDKLTRLAGTGENNVLNIEYLRDWIKQVQSKATEFDRRKICDLTLGQLFGRASRVAHGGALSSELAMLTEEIGSDEFFRGFVNGVLNSRGVVSRDPAGGGEPERKLIERYQQLAAEVRLAGPRVADALLELVRHYEWDAKMEDDEAERLRTGKF